MADAKKIVRIDYKAYFADADRLYDTTNADAAKEAGIFNEKVTYAPMAYIVGSGSLYADLDAAIAGAEVGKEVEVTIPCEKAAGARNPRLIELHPIKEFYKNEINPYPGRDQPLPRHVRQPRQPQRCRHVRRSRPRQGRLQQPPGRPRPEVRGHRRRGGHRPRREGQVHHGDGLRNLRGIRIRHHGSSPRPRSASSTRAGPSPSTGSSRTTATPSESTASSSSRSGSPRRPTPPPPSDRDPAACKPFTKNTLFSMCHVERGGCPPHPSCPQFQPSSATILFRPSELLMNVNPCPV